MPRRRAPLTARRGLLDSLVAEHDVARHLAADPVSFVHRYAEPADRELVGLVAALLAFGNVKAVRKSIARVLDVLGPAPAELVRATNERALAARLAGFVHRVYKGPDVARVLARAGRLQAREGSLGRAFEARLAGARGDLRVALAAFADELRGERPSPGLVHLIPDPRRGSACKRLLLYLRWMCRKADGVDLGLWDVPASALLMPVDTHVHRIGRNLGLTRRRDASWKTAVEITGALAELDPADPVRYDFALCHMGVSRACPSRRDPDKCAACVVQPICTNWL